MSQATSKIQIINLEKGNQMAEKKLAVLVLEVQWWGTDEELEDVIKPALAEALSRTTDGYEFIGEAN